MIYPTVHINGTSRESLSKDYKDAYIAIRKAMDVLAKAGPHGRDYYPQAPTAITAALTEHNARVQQVAAVIVDLRTIAEAIA